MHKCEYINVLTENNNSEYSYANAIKNFLNDEEID